MPRTTAGAFPESQSAYQAQFAKNSFVSRPPVARSSTCVAVAASPAFSAALSLALGLFRLAEECDIFSFG